MLHWGCDQMQTIDFTLGVLQAITDAWQNALIITAIVSYQMCLLFLNVSYLSKEYLSVSAL